MGTPAIIPVCVWLITCAACVWFPAASMLCRIHAAFDLPAANILLMLNRKLLHLLPCSRTHTVPGGTGSYTSHLFIFLHFKTQKKLEIWNRPHARTGKLSKSVFRFQLIHLKFQSSLTFWSVACFTIRKVVASVWEHPALHFGGEAVATVPECPNILCETHEDRSQLAHISGKY